MSIINWHLSPVIYGIRGTMSRQRCTFLDDYGRSTATNMLWYRDTAKSGAEPNEFAVPGAALLPSTNVADGASPTGAQIRALDFTNTLRNPSTT